MRRYFASSVLLAALAAFCPQTLQAQLFHAAPLAGAQGCGGCDGGCSSCAAAPPAPVMIQAPASCTRMRPVVQTQLQPQQVVTYRDVAETTLRPETYTENVPVSTTRNVTVDEGGYKMVWVPKPVTRQVAQTSYVQQTKTRMVPQQVIRRVPQVSTRLVPVQTVSHVLEQVPAMVQIPAAPCLTGHPAMSMAPSMGYPTTSQLPMSLHPSIAVLPGPAYSNGQPQWNPAPQSSSRNPVDDGWEVISPRTATPYDEAPRSAPAGGNEQSSLRSAPSAATAWQFQRASFQR